jgi:hypothetical protein
MLHYYICIIVLLYFLVLNRNVGCSLLCMWKWHLEWQPMICINTSSLLMRFVIWPCRPSYGILISNWALITWIHKSVVWFYSVQRNVYSCFIQILFFIYLSRVKNLSSCCMVVVFLTHGMLWDQITASWMSLKIEFLEGPKSSLL